MIQRLCCMPRRLIFALALVLVSSGALAQQPGVQTIPAPQQLPSQQSLSPDLPDDLSAIDIELFMNRIYALASQV